MKTYKKRHSGGESCSCTTCVYKSESDHPSLKRFIAQGSRIDRLYYGKYIPLRERKLLGRLVRTRAAYDDIRAQLLSDSTVSISTKGDIKPRKEGSNNELDDTEKSDGAILHLVNMVDKGAALGSKTLSDCCSCCSCSSNIQIHEHAVKKQRQRRVYGGAYEYHTKERFGETYNRKKGVRFKAKHIRSDPCTCTFKFSGLIKKHSNSILRKIRPGPPLIDLQPTTVEEIKQKKGRLRDFAHTSYENIKQSNIRIKEKISEGITKMRESQTRLQENLELHTKKSLEKLSQAKNKVTSKVKASVQKIKAKKIAPKLSCLCPERDIAFQVKKDSISKFKDELTKKQIMKDWECEPECIKETCVPEECFIKLKYKRSKQKNLRHKGVAYNIITQDRQAGEALNHSNNKTTAQKLVIAKTTGTQRDKPILRAEQSQELKNVSKKNKSHKTSLLNEENCECKVYKDTFKADKGKGKSPPLVLPLKKKSIHKTVSVTATPEIKNVHHKSLKHPPNKMKLEKTSLERKSCKRQAVRIGSSFSFNIEFYKNTADPNISTMQSRTQINSNKRSGIDYNHIGPQNNKIKKRPLRHHGSQVVLRKSLKATQSGGHALKRCFCTLKLKAKPTKTKNKRPERRNVITTEKSTITLGSSIQPCTFDCTPESYCEINECKRKIKLATVQTNTYYKPKGGFKQKMGKQLRKKFNLLSYECEPGVCIPGDCNPYQCIKLINKRLAEPKLRLSSCQCAPNLSVSRKSKSTSSFTSRSFKPSKAKYVQSMLTQHSNASQAKSLREDTHIKRRSTASKSQNQAVRIGSTFSFNIEFYKGAPYKPHKSTELKSLSIKPKQQTYQHIDRKERKWQENVRTTHKRSIPTQMYKKERNVIVGTKFRRCFCTLKLHKKEISKIRSKKTITTGTGTIESASLQKTANKSTKTKLKYPKRLEPYECEPFVCIPGACDPYACLERINKRNIRLKEVGLITDRPDTTSSSTYSEKPKVARTQFRPVYKEQNTLIKAKKPKKIPEDKSKSDYSDKSRQAVKIGSSFSFDIEFYKKNSSDKEIKYIYPRRKTTKTNSSKKLKNKAVKINKLNVTNIDTQMEGPSKHHKSSSIRPLLKRCFCTLNLQRKWKHQYSKKEIFPVRGPFINTPTVYAVNQTMVGHFISNDKSVKEISSLGNSFHKNYKKRQLRQQNLYNINYRPIEFQSQELDKITSNVYMVRNTINLLKERKEKYNVHRQKVTKHSEIFFEGTPDTRGSNRYFLSLSKMQHNQNTALTSYFRQCFCTMNLKVENKGITKAHEKLNNSESIRTTKLFSRRLKPYECEPGVCVPGECNPYECKKMISKRLMKTLSKKSSTEYRSQSISSSAYLGMPKHKAKKQQLNSRRQKAAYVYKKSPKNNHKQSVRVGSSFSFDIQFYKQLSPRNNISLPKYSSDTNLAKYVNHSSSESTKRNIKHASQSQSVIVKTKHKKSLITPNAKRCFCTLKLQKKGRIHKKIMHKQQYEPLNALRTVNRGQNTKKFKPLKIAQSLRPYECDRNICIPGECDPYQCLEIMKNKNYRKKNEFGTSSVIPNTKSRSSITDQSVKIQKSRAVYVKPKKLSSKSKHLKYNPGYEYTKPLRQTVRVGSSFSFNIEFSKDQVSPFLSNYVPKEPKENRLLRLNELPNLKSRAKINLKKNKKIGYKPSQIEVSTLNKPVIKRCFCTAQLNELKNNKDMKTPDRQKKTFLQNCLCLLKKIKQPKNFSHTNNVRYVKTENKKINTRDISGQLNLDLYECKPGICIPGECNPYLCEKIMKTRTQPKHFKASNADTVNTRSVSSNSPMTFTKDVKISSERKKIVSNINNKPIKSYRGLDRNVVRIGSKFSFDIEFSKNKVEDVTQSKNIVTHKGKLDTKHLKKLKADKKKTLLTPGSISQASQAKNNMKDRGTGFNNLIKRCFCTLKLYENRKNHKHKGKKKEIIDQQLKVVKTKGIMTEAKQKWRSNALMPFECEPNVCIPYECNPHECEKLIRLRNKKSHYREFGISTALPTKISVASTNIPKRLKVKTQSNVKKHQLKKPVTSKYADIKQLNQSKQSVKLGSSFSFNIEFYKDNNGIELEKFSKKDRYEKYGIKRQNKGSNKYNTNQAQVHHVTKTLSTMTGISPLKKCFCTLSLRKPVETQPLLSQKIKTNVSTATDIYKSRPILNLLPYECEPNVCIPGECNPVKCFEIIKRRQQYKNSKTSTEGSQKKSIAIAVAPKIRTINKKSQNKHNRPIEAFSQLNPKLLKENYEKQPFKQVRIGSNFSFDVEFYKENIPQISYLKANRTDVKQRGQESQKQRKIYNGNKLINNINLPSRGIQSDDTNVENKSLDAGNILKRCFCTLKLQKKSKFIRKKNLVYAHEIVKNKLQGNHLYGEKSVSNKQQKLYSKGVKTNKLIQNGIIDGKRRDSAVTPFIKRCFCVFKLHKIGNQHKKKTSFKHRTKGIQIISKDKRGNRYMKRKLEPFECEPNVCVPGYCDPYQCEQRIKKRLLKESYTETGRPSNISTLSATREHKSKPVKLQTVKIKSPERQHGNKKIFVEKTNTNLDRQVVRIGSNFSFDIEFFKNSNPSIKISPEEAKLQSLSNKNSTERKQEYRKITVNGSKQKEFHNRALESANFKKESKSSTIRPFLKRCFCTLKLQKNVLNQNPKILNTKKNIAKRKQKPAKDKKIATNKIAMQTQKLHAFECEPYFCIPGKCNPYECEKRIKLREKRNTITQVFKEYSSKSAGKTPENYKSQKNQTNTVHTKERISSKPYLEQSGIVEVPRFAKMFNKQAVKVGSSFSFNIEFYKEKVPQISEPMTEIRRDIRKQKNILSGGQNLHKPNLQSHASQGDYGKTKNRSTEVENVLKRCFCTLKLQNKTKIKKDKELVQPVLNKIQFPQTFEVRRVAVQHKPKMLPKQTYTEVKSVATKINKKLLTDKTNLNAACNPYICKNGKTALSYDMKTILPYVPKKFNKTYSNTELSLENDRLLLDDKNKKLKKTIITNHGKRLTRKKSRKRLHNYTQSTIQEKPSKPGFWYVKNFFIRCTQILRQKTSLVKNTSLCETQCINDCNKHQEVTRKNKLHLDAIKSSKSERQARPNRLMSRSNPKKSKSLKLGYKNDIDICNNICPYYNNKTNNYQGGDTKHKSPVVSFNINKKGIGRKKSHSNKEEIVCKYKTETNPFFFLKKSKDIGVLCSHCRIRAKDGQKGLMNKGKGNTSPLKVHFLDTVGPKNNFQVNKTNVQKLANSSQIAYNDEFERADQFCKYCYTCGRKINKEEFHKAAGDQLLNKKKIANTKHRKIKKIENVCSGEEARKPLFEMHLDSGSYDLLNKDEVVDNVTKLNVKSKKKQSKGVSKGHEDLCRCCICLAKKKKTGANITVPAKGSLGGVFGKLFTEPKLKEAKGKPCVCGSMVCAKKVQNMVKKSDKLKQRYKWKHCVCGSPICDRETVKMKNMSDKLSCICKEEEKKRKKKLMAHKLKIEKKERRIRLKKQKKEDVIRNKKRRKEHKRMEKLINKNASDLVLLGESAIDVGKLGITACTDVLRLVARSASDPKHAYKTLVTLKENPTLLARHLKSAYDNSGVAATTRRVRLRCLAMKGIKKVKKILESYAITKYILNINSKDPKQRLVKPQRVRERYDFGCSLYMGSLRKRPYLSVYDRCPWFYPHFLSLLNVWKQFMDITLFLLAVVVWSPCILGMELCRACMCCFFCTG